MMMTTMMMQQAFPRPPPPPAVVACRCCCKFEIADYYTLPSLEFQNQGRGTSQVDFCDSPLDAGGQTFIRRMLREARKSSSGQVCSGPIDDQMTTLMRGDHTITTTAVDRNSGMDCHDHQEERASTSSSLFRYSSILDCNSSSAAADVLCNDLNELRGGNDVNAGTTTATVLTRSQNCNVSTSSSVSPTQIECFNEAEISAACLLLEMRSIKSTSSHSADHDIVAEEESSQKQPLSIIRVSDHDHNHAAAAPSLPPVRRLSELMGAESSAGCPRASTEDDEELGGTVQERKAAWEGEAAYSSSSTPRSLRIELRTLGKKRIKPRKDERELVFGLNQEVVKFDILDRPTSRRRHYKSLRELLGVK